MVRKMTRSLALALLIGGTAIATPATSQDQKFPSRTIQYVVPLAAGSTTDVAARHIAQRVSSVLGWQIVVDNRPGASTMVGSAMVAKAEPDGHTLLMGASSLTVNHNLFKQVPFDTERDFAPISLLVTAPMVLVVHPGVEAKTLAEFRTRYAKPNSVTLATSGLGTMLGLATEVFKVKTGMDARTVVYRGGGPALTDVIAGHVQGMFGTPVIKQNIDKGDVRALAITGRKRLDLLPDVPTFEEAGLPMPEVEGGAWFGLFAPAGTPKAVLDLLNREFNAAVRDPEVAAALQKMGLVPHGTTPAEFAAFIGEEIRRWPPIFAAAGITPQ
jgi:tripartite-type tricarboxylate transporter receptor subunit TctC